MIKIHLLWDVCLLKSKILGTLYKIFAKMHVFFNKILKKTYVIEKETCINRSLFIYDVSIYLAQEYWGHEVCQFEIQRKVLIFPMLNATETIKNWSKRKVSEVSKFSISSTGQNRKPGNLGNGHFIFSNHIVKLKFFLLGHIVGFEF